MQRNVILLSFFVMGSLCSCTKLNNLFSGTKKQTETSKTNSTTDENGDINIKIDKEVVQEFKKAVAEAKNERIEQIKEQQELYKVKETRIKMYQILTAIEMYKTDCNQFPKSLKDLNVKPPGNQCADWGPEPYCTADLLKDSWLRDFVYLPNTQSYKLTSLGRDGQVGGTSVDADINIDE